MEGLEKIEDRLHASIVHIPAFGMGETIQERNCLTIQSRYTRLNHDELRA